MKRQWQSRVVGLQSAYYVLTGLWPLVHLRSFEMVTGPKTDDWLVRMVGCLAVIIGAALGFAANQRRSAATEIVILAVGSALAFAAIDIAYVAVGQIAPIYLADAAVELLLAVSIMMLRPSSSPPSVTQDSER